MIYLAGPYSHEKDLIRELRYKILTKIAAVMVKEGEVVFSPITNGVALGQEVEMPYDFQFWENYCIHILIRCNEIHIVRLKGWKQSTGVKAELEAVECWKKNGYKTMVLKYINPSDVKWGVQTLVEHHNILVQKYQKEGQ
jgi:hypothetical protein